MAWRLFEVTKVMNWKAFSSSLGWLIWSLNMAAEVPCIRRGYDNVQHYKGVSIFLWVFPQQGDFSQKASHRFGLLSFSRMGSHPPVSQSLARRLRLPRYVRIYT